MGNLREMHDQENNNLVARWEAAYGSTFVYHGFVGGRRLMTTDPLAVSHILGRGYDYPKPDFIRDALASMVAGHEGLLTVEGENHRRQVSISMRLNFFVDSHDYGPFVSQRKILVSAPSSVVFASCSVFGVPGTWLGGLRRTWSIDGAGSIGPCRLVVRSSRCGGTIP